MEICDKIGSGFDNTLNKALKLTVKSTFMKEIANESGYHLRQVKTRQRFGCEEARSDNLKIKHIKNSASESLLV